MSTKQKRLDGIEAQLSPREFAMWLAAEARKYPSTIDFVTAVAKRSFKEWPTVRPVDALLEQASRRYPDNKPSDVKGRKELGRKLRMEFWFLEGLLFVVNEAIADKATAIRSRAALIGSQLQTLALQDALGRIAGQAASWIEEYKAKDAEEEEERQIFLKELASYRNVSLAGKPSDSVMAGPGPRVSLRSRIESVADDLTMLVLDVLAHKAAVRVIQEKYFRQQEILFRDVETGLDRAISLADCIVPIFNEYLKTRRELSGENGDQAQYGGKRSATHHEWEEQLAIDIDGIQNSVRMLADAIAGDWARNAKEKVYADSLETAGELENYLVQSLRRKVGMKA